MKNLTFLFTMLLLFAQGKAQDIVSISPNNINKGTTLNLTVNCVNTAFTQSEFIDVSLSGGLFEWLSATSVSVMSNTKLVATFDIPADVSAGVYDVEIYDEQAGSIRAEAMFTINYDPNEPYISAVSPNSLPNGQRLDVSITGVNTHFTSGSQLVQFVNRWGESIVTHQVTVDSDTKITANVTFPNNTDFPDGMPYFVFVSNGTDYIMKQNAVVVQYTEGHPEVTGITPLTGVRGTKVNLTIKAKDVSFNLASRFDISMRSPSWEVITSDTTTVLNDSTLRAEFSIPGNAQAGNYFISVGTDFDGDIECHDMFLVTTASGKVPELVSVTPNTGKRGQTLNLQITGANTSFAQATDIQFYLFNSASNIFFNSATAVNNTMLSVNITIPQGAALGTYTASVLTDNDGRIDLYPGFTVTTVSGGIPEIVSVNPSSGFKGQTLDLTITGKHTAFTQASQLAVNFYDQASNIAVNSVIALNDTEIRLNITINENAKAGTYPVLVTSELDGYLLYNLGFKVAPGESDPQLVSISKSSGLLGQTLDLTITGLNTQFNQGSEVFSVYFFNSGTSSLTGENVQALSNTQLKATFHIPDDPAYKGIYSLGVYDNSTQQYLTLDNVFSVLSVGLNEGMKENVSIFPVPARDVLHIKTEVPISNIQLINSIGQLITIKPEDVETRGEQSAIQLLPYHLKPGFYFLKLSAGSDSFYRKVQISE